MNILKGRKRFFKHNVILKLAIIVLTVSVISGVSAYLVVNRTADNQMTIGYVKTEIIEDYQPPKELNPGATFIKKVQVKNTGANACYVRVLVTFSTSEMESLCDVDYNTTDWEKKEDGYWYYQGVLDSGETTNPLFNTVVVKDSAKQNQMQDFDINIYHESSNTPFKQ